MDVDRGSAVQKDGAAQADAPAAAAAGVEGGKHEEHSVCPVMGQDSHTAKKQRVE
jgi:hypothetical protein